MISKRMLVFGAVTTALCFAALGTVWYGLLTRTWGCVFVYVAIETSCWVLGAVQLVSRRREVAAVVRLMLKSPARRSVDVLPSSATMEEIQALVGEGVFVDGDAKINKRDDGGFDPKITDRAVMTRDEVVACARDVLDHTTRSYVQAAADLSRFVLALDHAAEAKQTEEPPKEESS